MTFSPRYSYGSDGQIGERFLNLNMGTYVVLKYNKLLTLQAPYLNAVCPSRGKMGSSFVH